MESDFIPRVIPVLLLKGKGLYKGIEFKNHKYVGDPINIVKIFNDKEVDELVFFDVEATSRAEINYNFLKEIAGECFMPLSYGGGINSLDQIQKIIHSGVEKVFINSAAIENLKFISDAVSEFGSSTICVCIDYKKNFFGKRLVYKLNATQKTLLDPHNWAKKLEDTGVGEIILQNINADGTLSGYDFEYFNELKKSIGIPLIIAGGSRGLEDFKIAIENYKIHNMAGGACFIYYGVHRAVLVSYPDIKQLYKWD